VAYPGSLSSFSPSALLTLQRHRRYVPTKGMIRVGVDVLVEVVEGDQIGFTGARASSDLVWLVLARWGEEMLVGRNLC
jgi:hypothetical protein